ncbi:SOS response-associated peptidase [Fusibacter sp. JL298sf-3]
MCGQFLLAEDAAALAEFYDIVNKIGEKSAPKVIYPQMAAPVIIDVGTERRLGEMLWGFSPVKKGRPLINARSETVHLKPTFAPHLVKRRCVVPFSAYYEWDKAKQPHTFYPEVGTHAGFAGLYRKEADGIWRFVLLTRESTGACAEVHHRMPVVLNAEEVGAYLQSETALQEVLEAPPHALRIEAGKDEVGTG